MVKTRRDLLATAAALLFVPSVGRAASGAAMTPAMESEALAWVKANARTFSEDPESDELAELAGAYEAPIYGMLAIDKAIREGDWGTTPKPAILMHGQPAMGWGVGDHLGGLP
jgi:hypothetical protein